MAVHTRLAQQYESELVALRNTGYEADLRWGEQDAAAIEIPQPGGRILVADAVLGGRLADRDRETSGGWKVIACGDFNDDGAVAAEGDTVTTTDADVPSLITAVDLLSRAFFPALEVEL
jgi:hypothetical protein